MRLYAHLAHNNGMVSTLERPLLTEVNVSANYVPKIAKKLKDAKIVMPLKVQMAAICCKTAPIGCRGRWYLIVVWKKQICLFEI